jgi:nicotinamidase-related amidase
MPAPTAREMLGAKPSTASPSDSTLIIIDAQGEYAEGHLKVSDTAPRKAIEGLLKTYREAGATSNIVHVLHQEDDGAPVFTPGTKLAEEFEELKPKGEEKVVGKKHPGSFSGTDLEQHLKSLGDKGKKVVLTGYMAHGELLLS